MKPEQESLVKYRIARAWDTLDDAKILASRGKWNSTIFPKNTSIEEEISLTIYISFGKMLKLTGCGNK